MLKIYYHPLCPFSKQILSFGFELGYKFNLIRENYWHASKTFLELSPWGELPVILINDSDVIAGIYPCLEYFIDLSRKSHLLHQDLLMLTRIRQVINWFNKHFYDEVVVHILREKLIKLEIRNQYPDTASLRIARNKLNSHLQQLEVIISLQEYIAYDTLSLADITVASSLAVIDYFHEINWSQYPKVKRWYCLIKSRPSFRSTLHEKVSGINPPKHYLELDF